MAAVEGRSGSRLKTPIVMLMPTKNSRKPSIPDSVRLAPMRTAPTIEMMRPSLDESPTEVPVPDDGVSDTLASPLPLATSPAKLEIPDGVKKSPRNPSVAVV